MGAEARCTATWQGERGEGRALLETDELIFRGPFRVKIPLHPVPEVEIGDGLLAVTGPDGVLRLELGAAAARWAEKIRHPKTVLDRIGLRPASSVVLLGFPDDTLAAELAAAGHELLGEVAKADAVFLNCERVEDLDAVPAIRAALPPAGALWVVQRRAQGAATGDDVRTAGRSAGLVDVKVVRYSPDQTAHKFMIPKAAR